MKKKKKTTLKEVAEAAEVSLATVSIVLNGKANMRVSEETKQHILKLARELDYHPNMNAQILKGKTSSIVGLIIPDVTNPVYPEMVRGVMDKAAVLGYNVILFNSDNMVEREEFFFFTLESINAAGIIVVGVSVGVEKETQLLEEIQANIMPVVLIDRVSDVLSYVVSENKKGAYSAVTHLIRLGHSRIAILVHYLDLWIMQERYQGYCDALTDNGIAVDESLIFRMITVSQEEAIKQINRLKEIQPKVTAILVASGDSTAVQFISAANKCGLSIPEDLSVIGYDDIAYAKMLNPALASVWQPKHEMGSVAMQTLHTLIQQEKHVHKSAVLPTKFMIRTSVKALE